MSERLAIPGRPFGAGIPHWPEVDQADIDAVTSVVRSGRWVATRLPVPAAKGSARASPRSMAPGTRSSMNGTVTMEVALKALDVGWGTRSSCLRSPSRRPLTPGSRPARCR